MTHPRRHSAGFTLVELMVSISIGSAVVALLASSLWFTVRFYQSMARNASSRENAMDRLRIKRFLGSAIPGDLHAGDPVFSLTTQPAGSRLTTRISPGGFDIPGVVTDPCRLEIRTGSDAGLSIAIHPETIEGTLPGSTSQLQPNASETLQEWRFFSGCGPATLSVLGADGAWYPEWPLDGHNNLPQAVRIGFASESAKAAGFPDLIVAIPGKGIL